MARRHTPYSLFMLTIPLMVPLSCKPTVSSGEGADSSQCVDGVDNDVDGLTDCADPGCSVWTVCQGDSGSPTDTGMGPVDNPDLCINEFMASNTMTIDDGSETFPDWIELYNLSGDDIDLSGYFITDDLSTPDRQELGDLTLPAHGYLFLWASGTPEAGEEHLEFKLEKNGEEIGIYTPEGRAINKLTYGEQAPDVSAARMPDGGDWYFDSSPTPGESNGQPPEE